MVRICHITDRYIDGTRLRLREQTDDGGPAIFKLTQKVPFRKNGAKQELITSIYVTEASFVCWLKSRERCSVRFATAYSFGIDVFEDSLQGLRLAEAEFNSAGEADALIVPDFILHEVTDDERFTGGQLVCASRTSLKNWLAEYEMTLSYPCPPRSV